ncbi:ABC transporter ATP-binding protein / permease protein [[Mycoplasma] cavipharyngis]|uniref:ABC transporter ATP-binding protein n=1 Tax=[Mycoplasma] cavipharyngis TaxID=92757 RepID=UPI003703F441
MFEIIKAVLKKHYKLYILVQILLLLQVVSDLAIPILLQRLISIFEQPVDQVTKMIVILAVSMFAINITGFIIGVIARIIGAKFTIEFGATIRSEFYQKVTSFTDADLNVFPSSSLINRLGKNLNHILGWLIFANQVLLRSIFMFIGGALATFFILYSPFNNIISPNEHLRYIIILIVLAFVILNLVFLGISQFYISRTYQATQVVSDQLNNNIQETFLGIHFIKSYNLETAMYDKNATITETFRQKIMKTYRYEMLFSPVITLLISFLILIVIWVGNYLSLLNLSQILAITQTLSYLVLSIIIASFVLSNLGRTNVAAKRIYQVLNHQPIMKFVSDANKQMINSNEISFNNVNFAYFDHSDLVLKNINLTINANQTWGIIGKTGSGKSSFINLIARLYDPTSGVIKIGGIDVSQINFMQLRNLVTMVPQKNNLFSGTVASNLQMAKDDATEKEMWDSLEIACAADFVKEKTDGLYTKIRQRGSNLSGGQKQRLCIARALLKKARILILDDATSALDAKTEQKIIANLNQINNLTKIIVSQKISSIIHADQILVFDQGQIVAKGKHHDLLNDCQIYQQIFDLQMMGAKH